MFWNSFQLRLRALWRNRSHAVINIVGLALGITSAITIFLILKFELSYDTFRADSDRIYRVVCAFKYNDRSGFSSASTYPLITAVREDFPDAEYVSLVDSENAVITVAKPNGASEKFKQSKIVFVDSSYFHIIQQEWVKGNTQSLTQQNSTVLTESVARKYFGDEDPISKVIQYNSEYDLTVTGVVKDSPLNTDFGFDMFVSTNLGAIKRGWDNWGASASDVNCILKLHKGVTQQQMEAKMKGWHMKYFIAADEVEDGKNRTYMLQPMLEMHFDERYYNSGGRVVSMDTLKTLGLIGIVLLLTACINFINLNTVLIVDRSKEAGVRKVMGSSRSQLVWQFLVETMMITFVSLMISGGLVEIMVLKLVPILGYHLEFHPFGDLFTFTYLVLILIFVTVLAGLYPAIRLSRFQPVKALKSKIGGETGKGLTFRRSLIVFQLIISQVLIVCTIIVIQQINHFMSQPLGITSDAVVEFEIPDRDKDVIHRLTERMKQIPGVENFSASNTGSASDGQWSGEFEATVGDKIVKQGTNVKIADANYIDTYGIKLLHGENLTPSDTATRFLVTKTFTDVLGFDNPADAIGVHVSLWGRKAYIMGVVNDFNATTLHYKIGPTIILCGSDSYFTGAVRLSTTNMSATLDKVKATWEEVFPKYVYEQSFLDDKIAHFYDGERKVSYLVGLFAGVAIFIGCIGLYGLISFMARRKTKEIGIRKTLGASVAQVIGLFSKEFVILIGISFLISVPITYYFMNEWLQNFEYRIKPGVATFLVGVTFTLVVVISTVGFKSYRAARANPVDALRDE